MHKWLLTIAVIIATLPVQAQEIAYITDILRLGIHNAADTSDRPFQNLVSGTSLTILERVPNYARVKTADGREGWVKSAFLVTEKPAQLQLAEMEATLAEFKERVDAAEAARSAAELRAAGIAEEFGVTLSTANETEATLARLSQENESFEARLEQYRGALPIAWVVGALIVVFLAGVMLGTWWLDRSIRRRFGGHRIY
jgi:SH3 domain protein